MKNGRFGMYVTDGKINASIPRSLKASDVDLNKAIELLKAKASQKKTGKKKKKRASRKKKK